MPIGVPGDFFDDMRAGKVRSRQGQGRGADGGRYILSRIGEGLESDFAHAHQYRPSSRRSGDVVIQIKTRHTRRLRSHRLGDMLIEHTYIDRPASLETWVDHCATLAAEFGISALEVHTALFAQLPEIFGR